MTVSVNVSSVVYVIHVKMHDVFFSRFHKTSDAVISSPVKFGNTTSCGCGADNADTPVFNVIQSLGELKFTFEDRSMCENEYGSQHSVFPPHPGSMHLFFFVLLSFLKSCLLNYVDRYFIM